MQFTWLWSKT